MVSLKTRYLECLLRNVRNIKHINQRGEQLSLLSLHRAFTNVANEEGELEKLPRGFEGWEPVDDVYRINHYPVKVRSLSECLDDLRAQDKWAYCRKPELYSDRTVNLSLLLDLVLEKKKKMDPFQGMVILPHRFQPNNKVLCFAEGEHATEALDSGAHMIGDQDTIDKIMKKQFRDYDNVVATPSMMASLMPIKSRLRKRFPNPKRGSVSVDIKNMVDLFLHGTEYKVQSKVPHINVAIGKLSLNNSQLEENVKTIIEAVCKHKPPTSGPLIKKVTINAFLLDGHPFSFKSYVPVPSEDDIFQHELQLIEEELQKKM